MLLGQLGILQTQVGNFHIALTPLDEREKLPYVDNSAGLAVRLARARALLHVGHMRHAAETAEQALAMTDQTPYLRQYRVLALDRAALYALAARGYERALALYEELLRFTDASPTSQRNRVASTRRSSAGEDLGGSDWDPPDSGRAGRGQRIRSAAHRSGRRLSQLPADQRR